MNEQELRAIVREAIAAVGPVLPPSPASSAGRAEARDASAGGSDRPSAALKLARLGSHSSHAMFPVPSGADADGPCVIEPTVMCNHCGYCKSYGH